MMPSLTNLDQPTASRSEDPRLSSLDSYAVLDTPQEAAFDDVVLLASQICDTPIALVSFVDADRQWFKTRLGIDAAQTPLCDSVCAHAIREHELLVVPDLLADERTSGSALVTGDPNIRFYAGAVLRSP